MDGYISTKWGGIVEGRIYRKHPGRKNPWYCGRVPTLTGTQTKHAECQAADATSTTIVTWHLRANSSTLWIQIEAILTFYFTSKVLLESKMYETLLSNLYWSFLSTMKVYVAYLAILALNNSKSKTSMYICIYSYSSSRWPKTDFIP